MDTLASLFVGQPLPIATVAGLFLAGGLAVRYAAASRRCHRPLLVAAAAWGLYAAWEWLVLAQTPEANIRVDLLLLWPVLFLISLWALVQLLRLLR